MFVSCTTTMFSQAYIDQDTLLPATHFPPLQPNQYFIGMGNRTPTPTPTPTPPPSSDTSAYALDQKNKTGGMRIPRKRSGKKDRHSKIVTAQGTRDRRMRLSLDIARRFFNLQDMLGFDKASSTVEWLLNKSKSAIKDLCRSFPSVHHHTEEHGDKGRLLEDLIIMSKKQKKKKKIVEDDDSSRTSQSSMAREESRTMARSRARERTLEKMRSGKVHKPNPIKPSSFQEQDEPLVKNSTPSSSTATYPKSDQGNNNISNFDENWGVGHITALQSAYGAMDTMHHHISAPSGYVPAGSTIFSTTSSDPRLQPQFADIQLYAKPWELFINPSLR